MRTLIFADDGAAKGTALRIHDAGAVGEEAAARILAAFRDRVETPLQLLACSSHHISRRPAAIDG